MGKTTRSKRYDPKVELRIRRAAHRAFVQAKRRAAADERRLRRQQRAARKRQMAAVKRGRA